MLENVRKKFLIRRKEMAKVLKCDICGKCFPYPENISKEINRIIFEIVSFGGEAEIEYFDICPDCVEAIKKTIGERINKSLEE